MIHSKRFVGKLIACFFCLFIAAPLNAQHQENENFEVVGQKFTMLMSGRCETSFIVKDRQIGAFREIKLAELHSSQPPTEFESLLVQYPCLWPSKVKEVEFGFTPDAYRLKSKFKKAFKKYVNRRRGSKKVPEISVVDRVDACSDTAWKGLFWGDGKNTIIITDDDRFFGMAGRAWVFLTFDHTARKISEADVYYRSNLFEDTGPTGNKSKQSKKNWFPNYVITHESGHIRGYWHTTWTNDYMMPYGPNVTDETFSKRRSVIWDLAKERDRLFYDPDSFGEPVLLPLMNNVIDLSFAAAPDDVEDQFKKSYMRAILMTSLKGYPGKELKVEIYKGYVEKWPTKNKLIVRLEGSVYGYLFLVDYWASTLHIGQKDYWRDLIKVLEKRGGEETIDGITYSKALPVTIRVEGYTEENNGEKKTIFRHLYIISSRDIDE